MDAKDFSKGFTLQVLYKYIRGKHDLSFQLTGVWYWNLFNEKLSFTGFADFWREDMVFGIVCDLDSRRDFFNLLTGQRCKDR